MPSLSARSLRCLGEAHRDLRRLFHEVAKELPIEVICGHRGKYEQDKAFKEGKSKLPFPKSKHNAYPSRALDVCPKPIDFEDTKAFEALAAVVIARAKEMGIEIVWGGGWRLRDLVHYELAG